VDGGSQAPAAAAATAAPLNLPASSTPCIVDGYRLILFVLLGASLSLPCGGLPVRPTPISTATPLGRAASRRCRVDRSSSSSIHGRPRLLCGNPRFHPSRRTPSQGPCAGHGDAAGPAPAAAAAAAAAPRPRGGHRPGLCACVRVEWVTNEALGRSIDSLIDRSIDLLLYIGDQLVGRAHLLLLA
jgi:hypothetical protein